MLAGIETDSKLIMIRIVGAMMLGLAFGVFLASRSNHTNYPILFGVMLAHIADFLVVLYFAVINQIPVLNSICFLALDLFVILVLIITVKKKEFSHPL